VEEVLHLLWKDKLPIVEQIIRDAIEYDSYSTGEVILPPAMRPSLRGRSPSGAEPGPAAKR